MEGRKVKNTMDQLTYRETLKRLDRHCSSQLKNEKDNISTARMNEGSEKL